MIYLIFLLFSLVFIYNTPLFNIFIEFIKKKSIVTRAIAIFGDALYMIGGGIVAGAVIEIGLNKFVFLNLFDNYGTIMIITGASIREFFGEINKKG